MRIILKGNFEFLSFFLVFKIWSILYSAVVNSELGIYDFCKPDSDPNQWGWGFNLKGSVAWGRAPGGEYGGRSPIYIKKFWIPKILNAIWR